MYKEILGGDTDGTAAHVLTEQLSGKSLTLARLNYEASIADKEHKKAIEEEIKITKETVATMKLAREDMRKFISSFEEGESLDTGESTSDVVKSENKQ